MPPNLPVPSALKLLGLQFDLKSCPFIAFGLVTSGVFLRKEAHLGLT